MANMSYLTENTVMLWCFFCPQIEREREEHLMPRLKLPSEEPEEQPIPVPPEPVVVKEIPVENNTQHPMPTRPEAVVTVVDNIIPTNGAIKPQPLVEPSVSSQSSPESDYSAGMAPSTGGEEEESSRGISPMTEETFSQPFIGPATQEDHQHAKMGFTGLKLGEYGAV